MKSSTHYFHVKTKLLVDFQTCISVLLNKLKSAAKNKTRTILRLTKKNYEDEELLHGLFLTTRKTAGIRNVFASNMSTNIKLSKSQMSKII